MPKLLIPWSFGVAKGKNYICSPGGSAVLDSSSDEQAGSDIN